MWLSKLGLFSSQAKKKNFGRTHWLPTFKGLDCLSCFLAKINLFFYIYKSLVSRNRFFKNNI